MPQLEFPQSKAEKQARARYSAFALNAYNQLEALDPATNKWVVLDDDLGAQLFREYMDLGIPVKPKVFEWILGCKKQMLCMRVPTCKK
jgi:hypothetical protein